MSLDLTILRLLKYRERCDRLAKAVPKQVLDPQTATILGDMQAFFSAFPDAAVVPHAEFFSWFKMRHPTLTAEQLTVYDHLLKQVQEDVAPALEAGLMERLTAAETAYNVAELIQKWNRGEEVDLYVALRHEVEQFENNTKR